MFNISFNILILNSYNKSAYYKYKTYILNSIIIIIILHLHFIQLYFIRPKKIAPAAPFNPLIKIINIY